MTRFPCPYLRGEIELTDERERHIGRGHPELVPVLRDCLSRTLGDPDEVRMDADYHHTRLFVRWFGDLLGGKMVVVAVVSSPAPRPRHWIVTTFAARRPPQGDLEWKRP
jgi:hypothetical protein